MGKHETRRNIRRGPPRPGERTAEVLSESGVEPAEVQDGPAGRPADQAPPVVSVADGIDVADVKLDLNLRVRDLGVAERWYARVFGVEPIYRGVDRTLEDVATDMVCFRLGGVKIWLLPRSTDANAPRKEQRVGMAFMIRRPLASVRAHLAALGVQFDDTPSPGFPINEAGVRVGKDAEFMYVLDPDGHKLEFCFVYPGER